jgi:hypothetical protein
MKTYLVTELDIEKLKDLLIVEDLLVDKWEETLEEAGDIYFCECEEKYLDYMCPCKMRN